LGHKNLNTTQIYMDYFNDDRKKDFSSNLMDSDISIKIYRLFNEIEKLKDFILISF